MRDPVIFISLAKKRDLIQVKVAFYKTEKPQ